MKCLFGISLTGGLIESEGGLTISRWNLLNSSKIRCSSSAANERLESKMWMIMGEGRKQVWPAT